MRVVISWYSIHENCIFQQCYGKDRLHEAKKMFYEVLSRSYEKEYLNILWSNLEYEFDPKRIKLVQYPENHQWTDRILSTLIVTYLT